MNEASAPLIDDLEPMAGTRTLRVEPSDLVVEEVSRILRGAGFTPMPQGVLAGEYCKKNGAGGYLFGGVHEEAGEVHAWDPGLNQATTNDPVEAAHNLAVYMAAKLASPAIEEEPWHEGNGEIAPAHDSEGVGSETEAEEANKLSDPENIFDADFTDANALEAQGLGEELAEEHPQDYGGGAFIFGDNLAHDRLVRQGQVVNIAADMIAGIKANTGWNDGEFAALQNHVLRHLDAAGMYVGADAVTYSRFVELSDTQSRIRRIEAHRDTGVEFIRTADRDAVAAFDPEAGWP